MTNPTGLPYTPAVVAGDWVVVSGQLGLRDGALVADFAGEVDQVLANLFTRMIAAPADHTFCYYYKYVDETSTHASQLAKSVCLFSPWQFLFWYDRPDHASDEPELEFFRALPTTWDETRVVLGEIGRFAVVARRHGDEWYVGCLNAGEDRTLKVPLDFLVPDMEYEASIYRDDETVATRTKVAIVRRSVDASTTLEVSLHARGGMALRIAPARSMGP